MAEDFIHKNNCRVCKGNNLIKILDLGTMPLANNLLREDDLKKSEPKFPLAVYFCKDCNLLQLLDLVNPEILFKHYFYQTSTSRPLAEHFVELGNNLADRFIDKKDDLFIDIGGNDAVLLDNIKNRCRVLNIEPARNIAEISKNKGVETVCEFFNKGVAEKIREKYGLAKVVTATNVFAHIDDLESVLKGIEILIGDKGVFVFEVHWAANLLGLAGIGGFDQIYHEHLSYFSLLAVEKLINRFNLKIFDIKTVPIHGQSLQVYVGKNNVSLESVKEFLEKERKMGLDNLETYLNFSKEVEKNKKELSDLLLRLKKENKKIVGYGAPGKGTTLLNYFQIGKEILDFIIDDSPLKQGNYVPGVRIPIAAREKLEECRPDYLLLLAWNYEESILQKEQKLRKEGVKFIIPVPKVKII